MRRIARTSRAWDSVSSSNVRRSSVGPVCLFCQHQTAQRTTPQHAFSTSSRPQASGDTTFLERTRRRIWGTDEPPGAVDPYTRQAKREARERNQPLQNLDEVQTTVDTNDIREYEARALREEKELFQAAVENAPNHEGYVPAQTWEGLETVGGEKEWDSGKVFKGFIPSVKLETPEEITVAIHRAVVEVFAALATSRPLKKLPYPQPGALLDETKDVQVFPTDDALGAALKFPNTEVQRIVLKSASSTAGGTTVEVPGLEGVDMFEADGQEEVLAVAEREPGLATVAQAYTTESLRLTISTWGRGWLHIKLLHPVIKFAIIRRIVQLTGLHISDYLIHQTESVGFLATQLAKPPAAKTLYQELAANEKLAGLANVSIASRRVTPVDKEKQLGRWKLIEQELRRRDLPVLGHN